METKLRHPNHGNPAWWWCYKSGNKPILSLEITLLKLEAENNWHVLVLLTQLWRWTPKESSDQDLQKILQGWCDRALGESVTKQGAEGEAARSGAEAD